MLATKKLVSLMTVLMMLLSAITITTFAAPLPDPVTDGTPTVDDNVFELSEPSISADEEEQLLETNNFVNPITNELVQVDKFIEDYKEAPTDRREAMALEMGYDLDVVKNLAIAEDGGFLIRGDSDHRAPGDILLVDDDNSDLTNTTQAYNNSGPYTMDTGKLMADALTANSIDFDTYIVDSRRNGPDFDTISDYSTIVWTFGYEWGYGATLTAWDYFRIMAFMDAGGSVWFTGPFLISNIHGNVNWTIGGENEFESDDFAMKYLGIEEYFQATGTPGTLNATSSAIMTGSEQYATRAFFTQYGDQRDICAGIARPVSSGGITILEGDSVDPWGKSYDDEPVMIAFDSGTHKAAYSPMDPAVIDSVSDRNDLVGKVMSWLGTPTTNLNRHDVYNLNVTVEDQSPTWTADFNFVFWGANLQLPTGQIINLYPRLHATVHTHEPFTMESNFESHGLSENNVEVRFVIYDAMGQEVGNFTKTGSVGARSIGSVTATFKPTRAGFYSIVTNLTLATDVRILGSLIHSQLIGRVRAAEWLDDLENGTDDWEANGAWRKSTDAAHYNTENTGWYWSKTGTATGDELLSPIIDLRFYNTSFQHQAFNPPIYVIRFHFLFTGRLFGTGQDYFEVLMKASNQTTWTQLDKIDGNTPGANNVPGDFSNGFWMYGNGIDLGNFYGQTVQFKWVFVKNRQTTNSWAAIDDFCVWMHHERNEAPWFLERTPEAIDVDMDVGTQLTLKAFVEDPTMDEPLVYEWLENYNSIGDDDNETSLDIPRTVPGGSDYERGKTVTMVLKVKDDLEWNDTYWEVHLLDPRPIKHVDFEDLIEVNEDEGIEIDFGTAANPKWFKDVEDQEFTVSSTGSSNIMVTEMGNNVLNITNKEPDWNGWDNITLRVTDASQYASFMDFIVEVHVLPINDAPRWKPTLLPDGEQDSFYSFNLTATDKDNPTGDLTFSDDSEYFEITVSGEIAFIPRNEHVGRLYFNVTVFDLDGLSDEMELMLFVVNVNDPPILRYIEPQEAYEDELFTINVADFVEDPDLLLPAEFRDRITYRDDTPKLDTNLETGIVTWDTPTNEDVGDFYFKITIQDSKGRYAEQEIKIEVFNTNDPPELGTISRQVLHQDSLYTFNVPYEDEDLDVPGVDEELTFSNDHTDLFTIDAATGRIQFTPENDQVGVWEITITVMDIDGETDEKSIIFEVLNENDSPDIEYIRVQELVEDVPFELQVSATDPDLEERLADGLPVDPDEEMSYRTNSTRVPIDPVTGLISFTPTNEDAKWGSLMVKITVVDSSSETATIDVLFNIEGVNDPPDELSIIGLLVGQEVKTDKKYQLMAQAKDVDNTPEELTYMWYVGTTLIGQTQTLEWQPKGKGLTEVRLVVSDPAGDESTLSLNVTIKKAEESPGFTSVIGVLAMAIIGVIAVTARRWNMR